MPESRRVFSTADGDLRSRGREPARAAAAPPNDGVVRVSRGTSGRRGQTGTGGRGRPPREGAAVASDHKRRGGAGGAAKDGGGELPGDPRPKVVARREAQGIPGKLAGG
jgi:hypothetical protein